MLWINLIPLLKSCKKHWTVSTMWFTYLLLRTSTFIMYYYAYLCYIIVGNMDYKQKQVYLWSIWAGEYIRCFSVGQFHESFRLAKYPYIKTASPQTDQTLTCSCYNIWYFQHAVEMWFDQVPKLSTDYNKT